MLTFDPRGTLLDCCLVVLGVRGKVWVILGCNKKGEEGDGRGPLDFGHHDGTD